MNNQKLNQIEHQADLCVIGGGMAGLCAAIAAARNGAKVVLIQDRPVLGGNASSEIRMWISGAGSRVRNLQETGIMEEILLENMARNPSRNFSIWDSILYEKVRFEKNIELLLNCACCDACMNGNNIESVTGFQLTTYTWHTVKAKIFADCSGDSILATLTGAEFMVGREAKSTSGEEFGLDKADKKTMGMSLMLQVRETDHKVEFRPPEWAYKFTTDEEMRNKPHECLTKINTNFYWIELGGEQDSIADTEKIRDELLKIAFGVWDHMKNYGDHGADNWELEWLGFLPGKRESRRYVGDYILNQNDVENHAAFDDEVAYGGWQIDNHLPGGFNMSGQDGNHLQKRRLSEPYGIPYRCLYSKNINNLMFAGRNISASHIAFASTRVMGTVGVIGQAVGTAAAVAKKYGMTPREIYLSGKIEEVQDVLQFDDCFLPHIKRKIAPLSLCSELKAEYGDCENLRSGLDRRIWGNDNGYYGKINKAVTYTFDTLTEISGFRLVLDSDLDREYVDGNPDALNISTVLARPLSYQGTTFGFPKCLIKSFTVDILSENDEWVSIYKTDKNINRYICKKTNVKAKAVRFIAFSTYFSERLHETYGSAEAHLFAFEVF